jgi:hypothetical protein
VAQSRAREREAAQSQEHGREATRGSIVSAQGRDARDRGVCEMRLTRSVGWTDGSR